MKIFLEHSEAFEVLKLYVEELNNINSDNTTKRTYMLQNIKRQSGSPGSQNNSVSRVTPTVVKTVSDLFSIVKQNDKNFLPKPALCTVIHHLRCTVKVHDFACGFRRVLPITKPTNKLL